MKRKAFKAAFPYTLPILAVQFSRNGLWNLHECIRVFFCLPSLHEFSDLRWLFGVCRCRDAAKSICPVQVLIMALLIQARHLFTGFPCWTNLREWGGKNII